MAVVLMPLQVGLLLPPVPTPPPILRGSLGPRLDRRTVLAAASVGVAALSAPPLPAVADAGLTASQMLTAGEYIRDIKDAVRGLEDVRPLLEMKTDAGYEAARIALRKPPVNGIRKPCTKLLALLPEGAERQGRTAKYELVKKGLETIDTKCRPDIDRAGVDLLKELSLLEDNLTALTSGLTPEPVAKLKADPPPVEAGSIE